MNGLIPTVQPEKHGFEQGWEIVLPDRGTDEQCLEVSWRAQQKGYANPKNLKHTKGKS